MERLLITARETKALVLWPLSLADRTQADYLVPETTDLNMSTHTKADETNRTLTNRRQVRVD